jgi:hypothetical protein
MSLPVTCFKSLNRDKKRKDNKMFNLNNRMMKIGLMIFLMAALALVPLGIAFAAGQPNQSCQTAGVTPGNAANAAGSAFNPTGTAGTVYAGQQPQNSNNPMSVSQYDVACFQLSQH